jgi:VanZ family protein
MASVVWGIVIEFLQKFYVPSRDFYLLDWAADTAGVLIAFWVIIRILKYLQKKKSQ